MFCTHFCLVKLHLLTSLEAERGDNIRSTLHPQVTKVLSDAGVMDSYSAPLKPGKLFFLLKSPHQTKVLSGSALLNSPLALRTLTVFNLNWIFKKDTFLTFLHVHWNLSLTFNAWNTLTNHPPNQTYIQCCLLIALFEPVNLFDFRGTLASFTTLGKFSQWLQVLGQDKKNSESI